MRISNKENEKKYDILEEYYLTANKTVAEILRYLAILIVAVAVATATGIFVIDKSIMFWVLIILAIGAVLPTILTDVLELNEPWTVYLVLSVLVLITGVLYSLLSYHVILMFAFPVIISCLYVRKSYTIFTTICTVPIIIISHIVEFYLNLVLDEPFETMSDTILYGILPRTIEFLAIALTCVKISACSRKLVFELLDYSGKVNCNKDMLHAMVSESDSLIGARSRREVVMAAAVSIKGVINACNNDNNAQIECYSGICNDAKKKEYYLLDSNMNEVEAGRRKYIIRNDGIFIRIGNKKITLPFCYCDKVKKIIIEKNYVIMSFYINNQLAGYVVVVSRISNISDEFRNLLKILYNNVDKAFLNVILNRDILNTQKELVRSLAEISESRSEQTGQHIKRVGEYMKLVGEKLKLSENECEDLGMASMLHDVGKLAVPNDILEKKGKLTEQEFEVIKSHVEIGDYLLGNCPGKIMSMARDMVLHHHERWDGQGYQKVPGKKINKYARYLAVVDVFDALVSERSYKKAWKPDDAYMEIVREKGKHFAPEAVDLFVRNYDGFLEILDRYPDKI